MKHAQNPRRGRSRSGPGKRYQHSKNRNYESGGGEAKVRGNARQILDKYQALARDAAAAGEHIQAEGYWQHAEHYYRILNVDRDDRPADRGNNSNRQENAGGTPDGEEKQPEAPVSNELKEAPEANKDKVADVREIAITQPVTPVAEPVQPVKRVELEKKARPVKSDEPVKKARPAKKAQPAQSAEPAEPVEQPEAIKPKRRGRPRKVVVETPEVPDSDASPETISA